MPDEIKISLAAGQRAARCDGRPCFCITSSAIGKLHACTAGRCLVLTPRTRGSPGPSVAHVLIKVCVCVQEMGLEARQDTTELAPTRDQDSVGSLLVRACATSNR
jgi:hypothetical protein